MKQQINELGWKQKGMIKMDELKEMLDKHDKILKDNNWIQTIIVLSLFGKNVTIEELDAILTKLENGTLTKEDILKKETNENEVD